MTRHRILAIASDIHRLRVMVNSLRKAGAQVDAIPDVKSIFTQDLGHRYIFIDIGNGDRTGLDEVLERCSPKAHIAVIVNQLPLQQMTTLLSDPRINHIIGEEEIEQGVFITVQKLLSGDIFGIERYLPENTPVHYFRLNTFEGRTKAIDTVVQFAEESKVRSRLRQGIEQVCEELLMNALYDAPVDKEGKLIFAEINPHDRVKIASPKPVSIRYAATDTQFVIAVRDRYGRLAKHTITSYINKCLHSPNQIDKKTYGAGLGLYLVANAAAGYIVNVAYDIATEVICLFDRDQKSPLRIVSHFTHPSGAKNLVQGLGEAPVVSEAKEQA